MGYDGPTPEGILIGMVIFVLLSLLIGPHIITGIWWLLNNNVSVVVTPR